MADFVQAFAASPSANVTSYSGTWTQNGVALPSVTFPRTTTGDTSGYTSTFTHDNPSVALVPGDIIGFSVVADDVPDSLLSTPLVDVPVTYPKPVPVAPLPPVNGTLVFTP